MPPGQPQALTCDIVSMVVVAMVVVAMVVVAMVVVAMVCYRGICCHGSCTHVKKQFPLHTCNLSNSYICET